MESCFTERVRLQSRLIMVKQNQNQRLVLARGCILTLETCIPISRRPLPNLSSRHALKLVLSLSLICFCISFNVLCGPKLDPTNRHAFSPVLILRHHPLFTSCLFSKTRFMCRSVADSTLPASLISCHNLLFQPRNSWFNFKVIFKDNKKFNSRGIYIKTVMFSSFRLTRTFDDWSQCFPLDMNHIQITFAMSWVSFQ